jgi:hypothetical protein
MGGSRGGDGRKMADPVTVDPVTDKPGE